MGLDAVELVMEVEDRFDVKLDDSECSRVRTVADLAARRVRWDVPHAVSPRRAELQVHGSSPQ